MEPKRLMELKIKTHERHVHNSAADQMLPDPSIKEYTRKINSGRSRSLPAEKNLEF